MELSLQLLMHCKLRRLLCVPLCPDILGTKIRWRQGTTGTAVGARTHVQRSAVTHVSHSAVTDVTRDAVTDATEATPTSWPPSLVFPKLPILPPTTNPTPGWQGTQASASMCDTMITTRIPLVREQRICAGKRASG